MIEKRWKLHQQQPDTVRLLTQKLNCDPIVAQCLLNRNIGSLSDATQFLDPLKPYSINFEKKLLDPLVAILNRAKEKNARILLYGDYDVDGMTSISLMASLLKELGFLCDYFVPNRFKQGYGLHLPTLKKLISKPYDILVTLDCGITNVSEIQAIKDQFNVEVIIIDHHRIPDTPPPADAILNPKVYDDAHHLSGLCTVGIVYKFFEYYLAILESDIQLHRYLDFLDSD